MKSEYVYPERPESLDFLRHEKQGQLYPVSESLETTALSLLIFYYAQFLHLSVCIESILARFYPLLTFFSKTACAFVDVPVNEEVAYL